MSSRSLAVWLWVAVASALGYAPAWAQDAPLHLECEQRALGGSGQTTQRTFIIDEKAGTATTSSNGEGLALEGKSTPDQYIFRGGSKPKEFTALIDRRTGTLVVHQGATTYVGKCPALAPKP